MLIFYDYHKLYNKMHVFNVALKPLTEIEITAWSASAYDFYARVVKDC